VRWKIVDPELEYDLGVAICKNASTICCLRLRSSPDRVGDASRAGLEDSGPSRKVGSAGHTAQDW